MKQKEPKRPHVIQHCPGATRRDARHRGRRPRKLHCYHLPASFCSHPTAVPLKADLWECGNEILPQRAATWCEPHSSFFFIPLPCLKASQRQDSKPQLPSHCLHVLLSAINVHLPPPKTPLCRAMKCCDSATGELIGWPAP